MITLIRRIQPPIKNRNGHLNKKARIFIPAKYTGRIATITIKELPQPQSYNFDTPTET